jgi:hypothetical protein
MPVRRFRSVEEMNQPHWRDPGDPELYRAIAAVWALGTRTTAPHFPPGIYKHRSIEAAGEQAERWAVENFRTFHARCRNSGR